MASVSDTPEYLKIRSVLATDATFTNQCDGGNFTGFDLGAFQVIPSGGADPSIVLMSWSEAAGEYIAGNPSFTVAGAGADVPYEFTVQVAGRWMFPAVTIAGGSVEIYAAGRRLGNPS